MRKIIFFLLPICVFLLTTSLFAEDEKIKGLKIQPGPGMEVIKMGNAYVTVPKGAKIEKRGTVFYVEGPEQYAARKFEEMEKNITDMDTKFVSIEEQYEKLKKELEQLKKRLKSQKASEGEL